MITPLLSPPVAQALAGAGYSKADVRQYVYEHTTMPLAEFDWVLKYTAIMRTTARKQVEAGVFPPEFAGAPDDIVRVLSGPDIFHVIVCGDPHRNRLMVMEGGHTQPTTSWCGCLPTGARCFLRSSGVGRTCSNHVHCQGIPWRCSQAVGVDGCKYSGRRYPELREHSQRWQEFPERGAPQPSS